MSACSPSSFIQQRLLPLVACWLAAAGPRVWAENSTCLNHAHCEYAAPLSKYVCGISTSSNLMAASSPELTSANVTISNSSCVTTEVTACSGATGSSQECTDAGACTYAPASGDSPATCTTTPVEACTTEEARESAAACFAAGGGACTFAPPTYGPPNNSAPAVFLLCTLGSTSGCSGASFDNPECELPPTASRDSLPAVQRTVGGDPHLVSEVQAATGMTEAQVKDVHGMSVAEFAAHSTSAYWKAAIATQQCATMCTGTEDTFADACLDLNNAMGTIKVPTEDGSDVCDHRACASSLAAIKEALMYGC